MMESDSDDSSAESSTSSSSCSSSESDTGSTTKVPPLNQNENSSLPEEKTADDDKSASESEPEPRTSNTFSQPAWMKLHEESDSQDKSDNNVRTQSIRNMIREALEQPDLYGIRRSERPRREVSSQNLSMEYDSDSEDQRTSTTRSCRNTKKTYTQSDSEEEESKSSNSDSDDSTYGKPVKSRRVPTKRPGRPTRAAAGRRAAIKPKPNTSRFMSYSGSEESASESHSDYSDHYVNRSTTTRVGAAAVSYKEHSESSTAEEDLMELDENSREVEENNEEYETIEKVLRHRVGRKGGNTHTIQQPTHPRKNPRRATGSSTVNYVVNDEGDPNANLDLKEDETEVQYFIKWKNWAHIHNSWESEAGLREQKVNGLKRLENYKKKEAQLAQWRKYANPDELELLACQQESIDEMLAQHCFVERIIKCKMSKNGGNQEYLVKWQSLPYSCATEEDGQLIEKLFPKAVEEYRFRVMSTRTPNKLCKALKYRPKFNPLKDQPNVIGGADHLKLRDYQLEGLNWLLHAWTKGNSVILADEMGLGKTIQTISFLAVLMHQHEVYGPFLLVVPLSTIDTWYREFRLWAPHINVIEYLGDVDSRTIIRQEEWQHPGNKKIKFNVLLTTYEILLKDKGILGGISWAVLGIDEAHRLKNEESLLYKSLVTFDTNHRLLVTGTPLQNSLKELWALLHFLMPKKYERWEDFEKVHKFADKTGFGHLHAELEPFLLRRVKKDVEKSLPAKVEQILRVEMSKIQKQYYKWILTKNYKELTKGGHGKVSSFINLVMELKKCCNHAFLVRNPDSHMERSSSRLELLVKSSGKLILLDKLLLRLKDAGHRVLIFSQMVRMLDILAEYLQLRRFLFQRLDGSIRGELRKQAMDHFNAEGSLDFCFLLSTRAGGLGVNLATADTVIIFDSDWNPQNDLQAQARAHRIGQKNQVSVYRLVTKTSVEEDILERAKKKMVLDHLVIQRMDTTGRTVLHKGDLGVQSTAVPFNKEELNAILKFGAEELFKESDDEDNESQVDIDDILRMAETRNVEESKNSATDELLSQFKVVSFDNLEEEELEERDNNNKVKSWDDIIPEKERRKIDDEELHKQLLELNPPPRSRKRLNNNQATNQYESDECPSKRKRGCESSDDSENEHGNSKKRGRPSRNPSKEIQGINNAELRRLIKSLKKFARPRDRIEAIARDSDLQDKSKADLARVIDHVLVRCEQAFNQEIDETVPAAPKHSTFKLLKVTVNAKAILQAGKELEPLASWMAEGTNKFPNNMRLKDTRYDCEWEDEDDLNLMVGVFRHGMGNWDAIKMDPSLHLEDKILPDGESKPQGKHLQLRVEYMLRGLRKHSEGSLRPAKIKKSKVKDLEATSNKGSLVKSEELASEENEVSSSVVETPKSDQKKSKKPKSKKPANETNQNKPMHITTGETHTVEEDDAKVDNELSSDVFAECKEKMRPVKKALKRLGAADPSSTSDPLENKRRCLLEIGDHVNCLLSEITNLQEIKEWRSNLWLFVSKFTELDAKRLHKLFKHMDRKRSSEQDQSFVPTSGSQPEHEQSFKTIRHHNKFDDSKNSYSSPVVTDLRPNKSSHSPLAADSPSLNHRGPTTDSHNSKVNTGVKSKHGRETDVRFQDRRRRESPLAPLEELPKNRYGSISYERSSTQSPYNHPNNRPHSAKDHNDRSVFDSKTSSHSFHPSTVSSWSDEKHNGNITDLKKDKYPPTHNNSVNKSNSSHRSNKSQKSDEKSKHRSGSDHHRKTSS